MYGCARIKRPSQSRFGRGEAQSGPALQCRACAARRRGAYQRAMSRRVLAIVIMIGAAASGMVRTAGAVEVAPFQTGLERLAEILGSLHYLRGLCGANDGDRWRVEMQALLDAEAPAGERRAKFIAHFNRGYRAYLQTYRTCTPAADLAIRRYLEEGTKIAREITARYSN